ncbi:MAG: RluA family pseudouridine synthase [Oscillospiraceae bacterium]|nr:RluA family pseudouridine synthase [Oscillospiraceae bacterium]
MELRFQITAQQAGERIDALLPRLVPDLSRSAVQKLLGSGGLRVNGQAVKKNYLLRPGDALDLSLPEPEPALPQAQDIPLDIVYEDADLIVVNKPRGLVVHPAAGHPDGTLVNALLWHCGDSLSGVGGVLRPGIVHRIDRDTSGLLAVAKNDLAHRGLAAQLADHSMFRIYEAVVCGRMRADSGTVDAPIGRHPTDRKRMAVLPTGGREAVTHWEVLARYRDHTHLRCRLETGRTHQIRVHLAHIGHPLAGDIVYGRGKADKGLAGQCLHARELELTHPRSGARLRFTTQLPDYFQDFLRRLGEPEA